MPDSPFTHPPFPRLLPLPSPGPAVVGGEPLDLRRAETAHNLINATPRYQPRPEVLALIERYFPNASTVGQHVRERR
jgi:hypothetical protein